jgi:riboflavin synthase
MFTGIVEELGRVAAIEHRQESVVLRVSGSVVTSDVDHGASIAVNGVCLTVAHRRDGTVSFDVMAETLHRSCLGALVAGDPVNLERALAATGRLDGHVVQGHVDGTAQLLRRTPGDHWEVVRLSLPDAVKRYVVEKGSIAVDGVSLTVSALGEDFFEVSLIPTTLALTTLGHKHVGDMVNLEIDVIAKYVERLLGSAPAANAHDVATP